MSLDFWEAVKPDLSAPLARSNVKQRTQAGRSLSYIEGWHAIAEANRIFGFGDWTRETLEMRPVHEGKRTIGRPPNTKDGFTVSYVAKVRVTVAGVIREGYGTGHGIDVDLGLAHESAIKEAETDAMKRALMTFGNPFGLALYDKAQAQVCDADTAQTFDDAQDESVTTYQNVAFLAFDAAQSVELLDQCWKEQVPKMNALGLTKDHPAYQKILDKFAARKTALREQEHRKDAA